MATNDVYLGNPNLKKAGTEIQFTKKQIQEWVKCKKDPIYFATHYIKIISLDEGLVPFDMYDFQKRILQDFHENRFNIAKLPRQTGKSTTVVAYLLYYAIFYDSVNIGILANKASTARELLGRLQLAYENLPKWMQHGILVWNKGNVELENGSKYWLLLHLLVQLEVCPSTFYSLTSLHSSLTMSQNNSLHRYILLLLLVNQLKS